jgi:hypothetical protein
MIFSGMPAFSILLMSSFVSVLSLALCARNGTGKARAKANKKLSGNRRAPLLCRASHPRSLGRWATRNKRTILVLGFVFIPNERVTCRILHHLFEGELSVTRVDRWLFSSLLIASDGRGSRSSNFNCRPAISRYSGSANACIASRVRPALYADWP